MSYVLHESEGAGSAHEHRFVKLIHRYSYRAVITWVYIRFVNGGLKFYGVNIYG